jgi:hypothetical protein
MSHGLEKMRQERQKVFFEELAKGERHLNEALIQQEDFLHDFFATYRAAMRTRERSKIRQFARLLLTAVHENRLGSDDIEEFRSILEDMSGRELEILLILQKFETLHPRQLIEVDGSPQLENDLQYAERFWHTFQHEVENKCDIQPHALLAILSRLARTGLYEPITGAYWDYTGGRGLLATRFSEFARWIELEANKT